MSPTVPMVAALMSEFIVPICLRGKGGSRVQIMEHELRVPR